MLACLRGVVGASSLVVLSKKGVPMNVKDTTHHGWWTEPQWSAFVLIHPNAHAIAVFFFFLDLFWNPE
jgi:hypothetical protein